MADEWDDDSVSIFVVISLILTPVAHFQLEMNIFSIVDAFFSLFFFCKQTPAAPALANTKKFKNNNDGKKRLKCHDKYICFFLEKNLNRSNDFCAIFIHIFI